MLDSTRLESPQPGATRDAVADTMTTSEFAELIWSDPVWVDAEFEAIMTTNFGVLPPWPPPFPPKPRPGSTGPRRPRRAPRVTNPGGWLIGETRGGRLGGCRQRSPPLTGAPGVR